MKFKFSFLITVCCMSVMFPGEVRGDTAVDSSGLFAMTANLSKSTYNYPENIQVTVDTSTLACSNSNPSLDFSVRIPSTGESLSSGGFEFRRYWLNFTSPRPGYHQAVVNGLVPHGGRIGPITLPFTVVGCDGFIANATLCSGDDSGFSVSYGPIVASSCTDLFKCEYICNAGYKQSGNTCIPYSCTGAIPPYSVRCSGDGSGLFSDTERKLVSSCTSSQKCEHVCRSGSRMVNGECLPYVCLNEPSNTEVCKERATAFGGYVLDSENLTTDVPSTLVANCTKDVKCEYKCKEGYHQEGGTCVRSVCSGDIPENAVLCDGDEEDLLASGVRAAVSHCNFAKKCEYQCEFGYSPQGNTCVPIPGIYKCTGAVPLNATLCRDDDKGLRADTPRVAANSCSPQKCEYRCDDGSFFDPFSQACIKPGFPPTSPRITPDPFSGQVRTSHPFEFFSTDFDHDKIRYQIDWDNDGTVDETIPDRGFVDSGVAKTASYLWETEGLKIFRARAQDEGGLVSMWSTAFPRIVNQEPPAVITGPAIEGVIYGSANPNGDDTRAWFRYDTVNPGVCNDTFGTRAPSLGSVNLGGGEIFVPFSQILTTNPGTTYYYCAIASNVGGTSYGEVLSFVTPPAIPRNLVATPSCDCDGNSIIDVSWGGVLGATSYDIEHNGNYLTVVDPVSLYSPLVPSTAHTYRVRAKNDAGSSFWSPQVNVFAPSAEACSSASGAGCSPSSPSGPKLRVIPSQRYYPDTIVGNVRDESVTVKNEGEGILIGNISSGTYFTCIAPSCDFSLSKDQTKSFTIRFTPLAARLYQEEIQVHSNDVNEIFLVWGNGTSPLLGDMLIDFQNVLLTKTSTKELVVNNIDSIAVTCDGSLLSRGPFACVGANCASLQLNSGDSKTYVVTFSPTEEKSYSERVALCTASSGGTVRSVTIEGTGVRERFWVVEN